MDILENKTFDEIQVGDVASLERTLTEKDIQVFAIMSGDMNPAHMDADYAKSEMFHKIIGHGMWGGALISTVLGMQLPGAGTIYLSQSLKFKKPVGLGDTVTVTVEVTEKNEKNKIINLACRCVNQHDQLVIEGEAIVIAPEKKIRRPKPELPKIKLTRSKSLFENYIKEAQKGKPLRAAVIYPVHEKILSAVDDAKNLKLIKPILLAPKKRVIQLAKITDINIDDYEIIDYENAHAAIDRAIRLAREDKVDLIIRGAATREDLLSAVLNHEHGLLADRVISNVTVMDVSTYAKPLILTDTLIHVAPNIDEKRGIIQNAIDFAQSIGIKLPKVAILAGADLIKEGMPSTIDAAALCKMAERGQIHGAIVDGPLTFDNVISAEVARDKGIVSPVIGEADIVVSPNLETGNMLAKQMEYLAESNNANVVLGARVPILMSHISNNYLSSTSCALAALWVKYENQITLK